MKTSHKIKCYQSDMNSYSRKTALKLLVISASQPKCDFSCNKHLKRATTFQSTGLSRKLMPIIFLKGNQNKTKSCH